MIKPYLNREETCPECDGDGKVYVANPFGAESVPCDRCKGDGTIWI